MLGQICRNTGQYCRNTGGLFQRGRTVMAMEKFANFSHDVTEGREVVFVLPSLRARTKI